MKRFLLAVAAVMALTIGISFTNTAMAHGPSHGHHHGGSCAPRYGGGHGGGYGGGHVVHRPSYGYGGCGPAYGYGYPRSYGHGNHGVIQIYGPRGGFTFGY